MRHKNYEEILKEVEERIKTMVKELLEALMKEEWEIYVENHPTNLPWRGQWRTSKYPAYGKGISIPGSFLAELRGGNLLVLSQLGGAWGARRLRGFAEIQMGSYHVDWTH